MTDLSYLHRIDPKIPIEVSPGPWRSSLPRERSLFGISGASLEELERISRIYPFAALQSELSLWTRDDL